MRKEILLVGLTLVLLLGMTACGDMPTEDSTQKENVIVVEDDEEEVEEEEIVGPTEVRNPERILLNPEIYKGMSKAEVTKVENASNRFERYHLNDVMSFKSRGNGNDYQFRDQENSVDSSGRMNSKYGYDYNANFLYHYAFTDNQLHTFACSISESDRNKKGVDYYGHYLDIIEILTEAYGPCEGEEYVWSNETYKDSVDDWNQAFQYGHFAVGATWLLDDMSILVLWDIEGPLSITYKFI